MRNPMADLVRAGDVIEVLIDGKRSGGGWVTDVADQGGTLTAGYNNAGIRQRVGIPPSSERIAVKVLRAGQPPVTIRKTYTAASSGQLSCVDVREVRAGSEPHPVAAEARVEPDKAAAREKVLLAAEERLIRSLGEAGYRSPWHTGDAALAPSGHRVACDDWQDARNDFVATFSDEAKERMLKLVTMDNPPLASDIQQARQRAAAAVQLHWTRWTWPWLVLLLTIVLTCWVSVMFLA